MSVLLNLKDRCLNQAFQDNGQSSNGGNQGKISRVFFLNFIRYFNFTSFFLISPGLLEFQRTLVNFIRSLPGNDSCCDCGSQNGKKKYFNLLIL